MWKTNLPSVGFEPTTSCIRGKRLTARPRGPHGRERTPRLILKHLESIVTSKKMWRVKIAPIGTRTRIVSLKSGALPACPFPAGTLIVCRAVYLFVHCAHFIALSNPFHYSISPQRHPPDTIWHREETLVFHNLLYFIVWNVKNCFVKLI